MDTLDDVYGTIHGSCAWCFKPNATKSYVDFMAGGEERVRYHVCDSCYKERV